MEKRDSGRGHHISRDVIYRCRIGLFIAFIGLQNGGIVVDHPVTLVTLGNLTSPVAAALGTILVMPATFSISNGIGVEFILFVIAQLAARRFRALKPATLGIALLFTAYFIFLDYH